MHVQLREFIGRECVKHPGALTEVAEFLRRFRDSVPAKSRGVWSRGLILVELSRAGFTIATYHKIAMIAGLAFKGGWRTNDQGQLEMVAQ